MSFEDVAARMRARHQPDVPEPPPPMLSELPEDVRHQIELEAHRERSRRMIIGGVIWLVIGIGITLVTHDMASSAGGGTYIVAYGPVIAGIIYLLKGLLSSPPSRR